MELGANGHLDAPFSDMPEGLMKHYGLMEIEKDPEKVEEVKNQRPVEVHQVGTGAEPERSSFVEESAEVFNMKPENMTPSDLRRAIMSAARAREDAAYEMNKSKLRKPEAVAYNPVPRNIRRQMERDAKKSSEVKSGMLMG